MGVDVFASALAQPNVRAFLRMIRLGEGTRDKDGYRRIVGGQLFESFADHPRVAVKTRYGWTSAAGAYQAMAAVPGKVKTDTWGDFTRSMGPHDFTPASQDLFAVWCIRRRKALEDVIAGRFEQAVAKCGDEWASLPGSRWGQRTESLARVKSEYEAAGGAYA